MVSSNNIINQSVSNPNPLTTNQYRFMIKILPTVNFFVTSVSFPGVTLGLTPHPTPFLELKEIGDKLQYDELTITFHVDEDLNNWKEIYSWIQGVGFPENFDQYKNWNNRIDGRNDKRFSDCTLHLLTNSSNPNIQIDFIDCFPANLSGMEFSETTAPVTASVSFFYQYFKFVE